MDATLGGRRLGLGIVDRGFYEFLAGRVEVPTGYARSPKDMGPPREMVERKYNLVHYTEQARGGHFAAIEQPQLFAADVSAFFTL